MDDRFEREMPDASRDDDKLDSRRDEDIEREIERDSRVITRENVNYSACFLDDKGMQDMRRGCAENGIELIGREQPDMHMTLQFYGRNPDKSGIPEEDLGRAVSLKVVAYGEYRTDGREDGMVENQGFKIDKESLDRVVLSDGRTLADACRNDNPHITLSLSPEQNERGERAKAVNTNNADFSTQVSPFYIEARIGVFGARGEGVGYKMK